MRQGLNKSLLRRLVRDPSRQMANSVRLYRLLEVNDFAGLKTLIQAFFASIPYEWYTNNDIARYEGYYASVFYSYFAGLGLDITVEDSSSHGRLDMAVRFNGNVYLFEFKVVELAPAGAAMAQLKEKSTGLWASPSTWWPWSSARTPQPDGVRGGARLRGLKGGGVLRGADEGSEATRHQLPRWFSKRQLDPVP